MSDRLVMPPVIDLLNFMSKMFWHGRTPGSIEVRVAVRLTDDAILAPVNGLNVTRDVQWRDAGIIWLEFLNLPDIHTKIDKIKAKNAAVGVELERFIDSCSRTVIPYGMLHIAIPNTMQLTTRDLLVTGRLHCGQGVAGFSNMYVCSIAPPAQGFAIIPCKQVFELNKAVKDTEQFVLYKNLMEFGSMREIMTKLTTEQERVAIPKVGIEPLDAGVAARTALASPIYYEWDVDTETKLCKKYRRLVASENPSIIDSNNTALNRAQTSDTLDLNADVVMSNQGTSQFVEYNSTGLSMQVNNPVRRDNPEKGIMYRAGRAYYNRKEFYEDMDFLYELENLLEASKKKVEVKVGELGKFEVKGAEWQNFCALNNLSTSGAVDGEMFYRTKTKNILQNMWSLFISHIGGVKTMWKHKPMVTIDGNVYKGSTCYMLCRELFEKAFDWGLLWVDETKIKQPYADFVADAIQSITDNAKLAKILSIVIDKDAYEGIEAVDVKVANGYTTLSVMSQLIESLKTNSEIWLLLLASVLFDIKYNFGRYMLPYFKKDDDIKHEDIFAWMGRNPYDLVFVIGDMKIRDLDRLAMLMGVFENTAYEQSRAVAYLHSVMLNDNDKNVRGKTAVALKEVYRWFVYGFNVAATDARRMINDTIAVPYPVYVNATIFGGVKAQNFTQTARRIPSLSGDASILYQRYYDTKDAIAAYIASGYGIVVKNIQGLVECLCDYNLLSAEYEIYKHCKLIYDYKADVQINVNQIQGYIEEFERAKAKELNIPDFKLEEKQKEAVKLLNCNIMAIYGSAGTGKTTTAEVLLYILQKALDIEDKDILFIAPTGKAATRLREVVKRPTSTIHRAIKLGIGCTKARAGILPAKVIIVDEASMITLGLMQNLMSCIAESTRVYFLGDIAQLLAIGFGKPFANMLNYIPVTTLEVSKRAEEHSAITRAANNWLALDIPNPLQQGEDFKLVGMSAAETPNIVYAICKHYLSNGVVPLPQGIPEIKIPDLRPEDIQVVSPVKTASKVYSTANLNVNLRDLFNPFDGRAKRIFWTENKKQQEFRVGDRVINTQNNANAPRYYKEDGIYIPYKMTGVMNGDVGIISDIVEGTDICFVQDTDAKRNSKRRQMTCYILVDYVDVDFERNVPITYTIAYEVFKDMDNMGTLGCIYATGAAIASTSLELAYALTTHKMEGSEAKLVIFPCFAMGASDFMSNNLVYTAMTRGRKGLYMLGDVTNEQLMSQMRFCTLIDKRLSVFDAY